MLQTQSISAGNADMIVFAALGVIVLIIFLSFQAGDAAQQRVRARLKRIRKRYHATGSTGLIAETKMTLRRQIAEEPDGLIGILLRPIPKLERLQDKLARAGYPQANAKVFLLRSVLVVLCCAGGAVALQKPILIGIAVGLLVGFVIPIKVLNHKINAHVKKFLQIFPDGIDLIVRGLRSGLPIAEGIAVVSREVPDPVGEVFRHVADSVKLGVPLEKALQDMARQMNNTEFNFFTTSIILQRETGGNLGEILGNLSDVLRKRFTMKMKIKAMTSEARASAIIVGSLPFFVSTATHVMSPGYLNLLWEDARGTKMLMLAACMLWLGVTTMQRMAKFEL
jgi:tight adherence protein B